MSVMKITIAALKSVIKETAAGWSSAPDDPDPEILDIIERGQEIVKAIRTNPDSAGQYRDEQLSMVSRLRDMYEETSARLKAARASGDHEAFDALYNERNWLTNVAAMKVMGYNQPTPDVWMLVSSPSNVYGPEG